MKKNKVILKNTLNGSNHFYRKKKNKYKLLNGVSYIYLYIFRKY